MLVSRLFALFLLVAGLGAGAWGAVVMSERERPLADSEPSSAPVFVDIGSSTTQDRQPARLVLGWGPVREVISGRVVGRVTALTDRSELSTGQDVMSVDGVWLPALSGVPPLWRNLVWGTTGSDVAAVAELLTTLGYDIEPTEQVNASFVNAVRAFETDRGRERTGVFQPSYVVWLPDTPMRVGTWAIDVGDWVAAESVILTERPALVTASAIPVDADFLDVESTGWVFDPLTGPDLGLAGTSLTEDAKAVLAESLTGDATATELDGVVRRSEPRPLDTVPTSAVILMPDASTCVVLEKGGAARVTVVGGRGGVSEILPLDTAERILSNPKGNECD